LDYSRSERSIWESLNLYLKNLVSQIYGWW
jgi:hypothetical protein